MNDPRDLLRAYLRQRQELGEAVELGEGVFRHGGRRAGTGGRRNATEGVPYRGNG